MYFDVSPKQRGPRARSPPPSTSTTTLLPFRRVGRGVDVAASMTPVQAYAQPQWSVDPREGPRGAVPVTSSPAPPPPQQFSRDEYALLQQQQQQQPYGSYAAAAVASSPPHAYYVGGGLGPTGVPLAPPPHLRSPYRDPVYATALRDGERSLESRRASLPSAALLSSTPLPRQPFASSSSLQHIRRDDMEEEVCAAEEEEREELSPEPQQRTDETTASQWKGRGEKANTLEEPPTRVSAAVSRAAAAAAKGTSGARPRGRGIVEVRPGCTTSTERVRYRNNVTKKLIDLYDEVAELYECRENMNFQVTQAMRSDPRYTKERHGEVRLAYKPTPQQQQAVADVDLALEALHDACHELVAAYLTPEEKRYLGIDTHLFQTAQERTSTYQYAPAGRKDKSKGTHAAASSNRAAASGAVDASRALSPSSDDGHAESRYHDTPSAAAGGSSRNKFTTQTTSRPSAPVAANSPRPPPSASPTPLQDRTASTIRASSPSPPSAVYGAPANTSAAEPQYNFVSETNSEMHDASNNALNNFSAASASPSNGYNRNTISSPPPAPATPAYIDVNVSPSSPSASPAPALTSVFEAAPAEPEDTVAVGSVSSPEKMYAPAPSTSSLGGGGWPSDTASASLRASPLAPRTAVAAPPRSPVLATGGSAALRGPQGQPLVKMPAHIAGGKLPPGIPPGAKLVKMPAGSVPPSATLRAPPPPAASASAAAAEAALSSSHPPSHPPSRTNSATNRTASTAPKAPTTRAEFKRFLIDSDSDSSVA